MRISDNDFLVIVRYQTKIEHSYLSKLYFSEKRNEEFYVTRMLHQGFPDFESVFLDSGKIGSRENCSAALVCLAERNFVQLSKLDYALVSTRGYSEILRGRVKPVQLRF